MSEDLYDGTWMPVYTQIPSDFTNTPINSDPLKEEDEEEKSEQIDQRIINKLDKLNKPVPKQCIFCTKPSDKGSKRESSQIINVKDSAERSFYPLPRPSLSKSILQKLYLQHKESAKPYSRSVSEFHYRKLSLNLEKK